MYCLLFGGFPFEVCWFFVIEKWTTSVRDFPFVFIQRKCEEMGNKGFVLVTKHFVLYISSLSGLDCLCTYYWNKESKDWKRFFFLKVEKFIDFMDISFNFVSVWNVWHVSILLIPTTVYQLLAHGKWASQHDKLSGKMKKVWF